MPPISTKLHGVGDYATGIALLAAPKLLRMSDGLASAVLRGTGVAILGVSVTTDYELGITRRLPMRTHLMIDAATGALMTLGAVSLRRRDRGVTSWLPHGLLGVGQVGGALLTKRRPGDRTQASASPPAQASASPPAQSASLAAQPGSESDDVLVAREESAAAAEAARIGGFGPVSAEDPALNPVYQAGGGEQEGWEEAEAELIENATHGDGEADPRSDAFTAEVEADRSGAVYAEPDSLRSTEVVEDSGAGEDAGGITPRAS
jgi:hypothetical protein